MVSDSKTKRLQALTHRIDELVDDVGALYRHTTYEKGKESQDGCRLRDALKSLKRSSAQISAMSE